MALQSIESHLRAARGPLKLCPLESSIVECKEFAGKVIQALTLYMKRAITALRVNIEFTERQRL